MESRGPTTVLEALRKKFAVVQRPFYKPSDRQKNLQENRELSRGKPWSKDRFTSTQTPEKICRKVENLVVKSRGPKTVLQALRTKFAVIQKPFYKP